MHNHPPPQADISNDDGAQAATHSSGISPPTRNPSPNNNNISPNPPSSNDFSDMHVCPITQEPPVDAVTFDIEDRNHNTSQQVFERSALFRHIATQGSMFHGNRMVRHPNTGGEVRRDHALNLMHPVS